MEQSDEKGLFAKYGSLALFILLGATTQVLMSNQRKKLTFVQNLAIFLSCCLVGGTYAVYFYNNKSALALSGLVAAIGNHVTTAIILIAKDPNTFKEIIKDKISKL